MKVLRVNLFSVQFIVPEASQWGKKDLTYRFKGRCRSWALSVHN